MCQIIRSIFSQVDCLVGLINSTINMFFQNIATKPEKKTDEGSSQSEWFFPSKVRDLKLKEIKWSIVSQHYVVYKLACDLYDADYVGYEQPDTFINALLNTSIWLSVTTFKSAWGQQSS